MTITITLEKLSVTNGIEHWYASTLIDEDSLLEIHASSEAMALHMMGQLLENYKKIKQSTIPGITRNNNINYD